MSREKPGSIRNERRRMNTRASDLIRDVCIPAGCANAMPPSVDNDLYSCFAQPPIKVNRSIGGLGCDKALIEVPGILHPDSSFLRKH